MNGRSDASTSTDDVKSRPLCLFYFTHPFGVLSPEPPTVAPPHVARAFLNMQPVAPFAPFDLWTPSSDPEYDTASSASSRPAYELGKVTLHRSPVTLRPPDLPRPPRADSIASSLFSSDIWFNSSSSSRTNEYSRRVIPYNRILPPLQLPRTITDLDDSDEYWPKKCLNPEKFSLPPIELPALREETVTVSVEELSPASETRRGREAREGRWLRREGVLKPRRRRRLDARRMLACLMRRAVRGGRECNPSPALREVLHVIRAAWAEPASLYDRFHYQQPPAVWRGAEGRAGGDAMLPRDASPGLLRRRYSVPETIMRRYKVSQQKTECEGSVAGSAGSASAGSGAGGRGRGAPSHAPHTRDRELMRRSALLRRMWGRAPAASSPTPASPPTSPPAAACCRCCCDHVRPSRSLDGSRADLRPRLSASTYRSHAARGLSSCLDTDTDRPPSLYDEPTSEAVTVEIESASELPPAFERSALSERVPRISSSSSTSHQSTSAEQDTEVHPTTPPSDDHSTLSVPNENHLLLTTNPIVAVETPSSCEMLEIVVTQTSEPGVIPAPRLLAPLTAPHHGSHAAVRLDIDRYVSDVLVESLNSLSDRLEYVTSSVEGDGKISVIEKEIKVKLHSTGVNTIVHLSPTSNNQIIFGNEELCDGDERDQSNNNPRGSLSIRDEPPRDDARNNNQPATPSPCPSPTPSPAPAPLLAPALMRHRGHVFEQLLQHDNVNKAVLQQIQKLFDEELQSLNNEQNHPNNVTSGISHIEISNVDVFLHENESSVVEMTAADTRDARSGVEVEELSGVGAGSYFETSEGVVVVPRFSALPHTDSMEVNTSSSEDADGIASECTSLVDSLDDPNSPRSVLIRRNFNNRKTELVRSAIDVLDLLPENTMPCDSRDDVHKDKPESFFITIKDNECECDKENFNVADRMPEKIKERLIRRHRRRQQRMECARRSRGTQHRDELYRTKREVERDCVAIINSLIDEVIAKIAKDEFKCARIKRKSDRLAPSKSDENYSRKNRKKNLRPSDGPPNIATKPSIEKLPAGGDHQQVEEKHQVRGKLSLMTRPPLNLTEAAPRRVYQKSEILEGNKCIEILEILEYVNGTQSSPGTPVSDDSPGTAAGRSGKRSRIPVPVTERSQRPQPPPLRYLSNSADNSPGSPPEPPSENTSVREKRRASEGDLFTGGVSPSSRRVLYPASVDTRPRSDSLRFRRVFDMIPEERSSVSVESSDVERAAPARTRSVATSPLPVAAAPPLRVKGGDMPRRARVWAPLGRREEGKPDKNDVKKASRPDTLPPTTTNLITNQHKRNNKTNTGKKITISKQREQHKPPPTPPDVRHHLDDTTDHQSSVDDKKPSDDSAVKTEEESTVAEDPARGGSRAGADSTSEGSDGGSDLLCSRWRGGTHRRRRTHHTQHREKGWSVTVAGSCAEALPADLEMRLRFPHPAHLAHPAHHAHPAHRERTNQPSYQCTCRSCVGCMCSTRDESAAVSPAPLPAPPTPPAHTLRRQLSHPDTKLTLTMKKEARDSSILASKSMRKSMDPLPELETFRSSRSKVKSSVKTRRGYSLHCWLPDEEPAPVRASNGLSVLGCAIIPELKPRVPTMSERDLTRLYTPRHYLRL